MEETVQRDVHKPKHASTFSRGRPARKWGAVHLATVARQQGHGPAPPPPTPIHLRGDNQQQPGAAIQPARTGDQPSLVPLQPPCRFTSSVSERIQSRPTNPYIKKRKS